MSFERVHLSQQRATDADEPLGRAKLDHWHKIRHNRLNSHGGKDWAKMCRKRFEIRLGFPDIKDRELAILTETCVKLHTLWFDPGSYDLFIDLSILLLCHCRPHVH